MNNENYLEGWGHLKESITKRKQPTPCCVCHKFITSGQKFLSLRAPNTRYGGEITIHNYHDVCWFFLRDFIMSIRGKK